MALCGPIRKHLLVLATLALLAPSAVGQSPPQYDSATVTKLKGTVEEMKLETPSAGKPMAYLVVKSGAEKTRVFLCPKSFLDEMGVTYDAGDSVQVTGSKVKENGADLILAREVIKSGDALTLRFNDGKPVW